MKKILKILWLKQKNNTSLRKFLSVIYFLIKKNKRKIHGKRNHIEYAGAYLSKVTFDIVGNDNSIIFKPGSRISTIHIHIRGNGHTLIIGENCVFRAGSFWFKTADCKIVVGKQTSFEDANISALEPNSTVEIGEDCMFSYDVHVRNGDSHSIIDLETSKRINYAQNIFIGDHVWLGAHVNVLKGVTIDSNSIVGIRSVVTNDIPTHSIAVGIPAKVKKNNINWSRELIFD